MMLDDQKVATMDDLMVVKWVDKMDYKLGVLTVDKKVEKMVEMLD